jgi:uncharacterized protein (DUF58 family)
MTGAVDRVHVDRWSGGLAGAVVLAVGGLLAESAVLLVAAAIPVAYVVYGAVDAVDFDPSMVAVERRLDREAAFPGDRVGVALTVTNESDRPLADLRVVDHVPEAVTVVDGHDRRALSLRPGESETVEYTVVARRGEHEFGPVGLRARSSSGGDVATVEVTPRGSTSMTCRPDLEGVPLDRRTRQFVGSVAADTAGAGVEFHSTREYRAGDPVSRIDWRRLAKSQELTTVNYREHRSARVVVAVDARDPSYVSPVPGTPTAGAICGYGGRRVFEVLRDAGHGVGAAGFGLPDEDGGGGPAWVEPGTGEETRLRAHELYDVAAETPRHLRGSHSGADEWGGDTTHRGRTDRPPRRGPNRDASAVAPDGGAFGRRQRRGRDRGRASRGRHPEDGWGRRGTPREGQDTGGRRVGDSRPSLRGGFDRWNTRRTSSREAIDALCGRLSPETQLVLLTPALDEFPATVVRNVVAYGHRVTVISPDVTTAESTGGRLEDAERRVQLEAMRAAGARVVDWDRDRPLALTLTAVMEGI